jgi:hypothetical protein
LLRDTGVSLRLRGRPDGLVMPKIIASSTLSP